jgi:hypothetical protein
VEAPLSEEPVQDEFEDQSDELTLPFFEERPERVERVERELQVDFVMLVVTSRMEQDKERF